MCKCFHPLLFLPDSLSALLTKVLTVRREGEGSDPAVVSLKCPNTNGSKLFPLREDAGV